MGGRRKKAVAQDNLSPQASAPAVLQAPPQVEEPRVQLSPEKINELQRLVAEMIVIGSELGLELGTSDCNKITKCPIALKGRELVMRVKEIREILKGA